MHNKILSERIKAERKRAGLKQREMADHLGISLRHYQRLEAPDEALTKASVSEEMLNRISKTLGIDAAYFTGETDSWLTHEGTDDNGSPKYMKSSYVQTQYREACNVISQVIHILNHYCLIPDEVFESLPSNARQNEKVLVHEIVKNYILTLVDIQKDGKELPSSELINLCTYMSKALTEYMTEHAIPKEGDVYGKNSKKK